jgi:hypothetical protein
MVVDIEEEEEEEAPRRSDSLRMVGKLEEEEAQSS